METDLCINKTQTRFRRIVSVRLTALPFSLIFDGPRENTHTSTFAALYSHIARYVKMRCLTSAITVSLRKNCSALHHLDRLS